MRWRVVAAISSMALGTAACRDFDAVAILAPGADASVSDASFSDAARDAAAPDGAVDPSCDPAWRCAFTLSAPEPVSELSSPGLDLEPHLGADGLTIHFASDRAGPSDEHDVYRSSRSRLDAPFAAPVPVEGFATDAQDLRYALSADGLELFHASGRPGGVGSSDLWHGRSAKPGGPFAAFLVPIAALNTPGAEHDPLLSPDGLTLYFVSNGLASGAGRQDVFVARRASRDETFVTSEPLPGIGTEHDEDNPAVSADALFVVFGSNRPGGAGGHDLWYARRASPDVPFDAPQPLPVVNTASFEGEPFLALGDRELWFVSDRPGGLGRWDFYRSRFLPAE
jgi:hypothetical protein